MHKRHILSYFIVALTMLGTLTACGFHLRGSIPLPDSLKVLYVNVPTGTFKDQLENALSKADATLVENQASANAILDIVSLSLDRRVGTLDNRGKSNSYNLVLKLSYELIDREEYVIRSGTLTEQRSYNFDPELVVESESEEQDLREDMEQEIALRIVRQLSTIVDYDADAKLEDATSSDIDAAEKKSEESK